MHTIVNIDSIASGRQSHVAPMAASEGDLSALLEEFPPVEDAFAYGSAVFHQEGYTAQQQADSMVDLVFCVRDPEAWHRENMPRHPAHYSGLAAGGPRVVTAVQECIGAGVYYNTLVRTRGRLIKYGIVRSSVLTADLLHWHSLYLSGRMHKPVRMLTKSTDELTAAAAINLRSAVATALLLLPARFDDIELLSTVCGLSYDGDVRMGIGESWGKVGRIVSGQLEPLRELYADPLAELQRTSAPEMADGATADGPEAGCPAVPSHAVTRTTGAVLAAITAPGAVDGQRYEQDMSLEGRRRLLGSVPLNARRVLLDELSRGRWVDALSTSTARKAHPNADERLDLALKSAWSRAARPAEANQAISHALKSSLNKIVRRASLAQTLKGVATAGALRAGRYALTKIRKRMLSDAQTAV